MWKGYADIRHFFFNYQHKKALICGESEQKRPYVPVDQRTDNELSVNVRQYTDIINSYWNHVIDNMLEGRPHRFSSDIGELRLVRYKPARNGKAVSKAMARLSVEKGIQGKDAGMYIKDHPESIEGYNYYNSHIGGYKFNLAWFRMGWNFVFSTYWNMRLSISLWRKVWDKLKKDPSIIYILQDSTKIIVK